MRRLPIFLILATLLAGGIANGRSLREEMLEQRPTATAAELTQMALLFETGADSLLDADSLLSIELLRQASDSGFAPAMNQLGYRLLLNADTKDERFKALRLIEGAAIKGDPKAASNLGFLFTDGKYVKRDYKKARFWLEEGVKGGAPTAMVLLGDQLRQGIGSAPDTLRADTLYIKAARHGSALGELRLLEMNRERYSALAPDSAFTLGRHLYFEGLRTPGVFLLQRAGDQDARALTILAMEMLRHSEPKIFVKGLLTLLRAAESGEGAAQFYLAQTLDFEPQISALIPTESLEAAGLSRETADRPAEYWYGRAAENGITEMRMGIDRLRQ